MYRLSRLQKHKNIIAFRKAVSPKESAFFMIKGSVAVITIVPFLILANAK